MTILIALHGSLDEEEEEKKKKEDIGSSSYYSSSAYTCVMMTFSKQYCTIHVHVSVFNAIRHPH